MKKNPLSRRNFMHISMGIVGGSTLLSGQSLAKNNKKGVILNPGTGHQKDYTCPCHMQNTSEESFIYKDGEMNPMKFLTHFDYGKVTKLPNGKVQREYTIIAQDKEIEVAPGVRYPAWTYNGHVPGPTLRCTEGDRLKINFVNASHMPHTIHFHGTHPAEMDGVFEQVKTGERFTYEFAADPFGLFLYHCPCLSQSHIKGGITFPTSDEDASWVFEVRGLLLTKDFTEKFSMDADFIFALIEDNVWSFVTEVGFGYFIISWFQFVLEGAYAFESLDNEDNVLIFNITAGFTSFITEWLTINIGVTPDIYTKNIENKIIPSSALTFLF
jgi:hypothetical protein